MPEKFFHIHEKNGNETRSYPAPLDEVITGNVGDVITLTSTGWQAQAPTAVGTGKYPFREKLTVNATNALSPLSYTPKAGLPVQLFVRGVGHSSLSGDFTVAGKNITIAGGGYSILVNWLVEAEYFTDDTIVAPTITSFLPTSASVGANVVITGTGFFGVQSVVMGGIAQTTYTVNSATQITVTLINATYTNNDVVVNTSSGIATATGFTYLNPTPTISSLSPLVSAIGNDIVITGTNYSGVTAVTFGGTNAGGFVVNSVTQITGTIADTGSSGTVQVTTPYGTATSAQSITLDTLLDFPRSGRFMTANTGTFGGLGYTVSASTFAFAGREAWRAFSSNSADLWLASSANNEWLRVDFPLKARVRTYTIFAANVPNNHHPKNWQFQASADGSSWSTLDTRTNQILNANTSYNFTFTNNTYYRFYRIFVQDSQTAGWAIAIGKLTLKAV